jgi:hypothetical protein
MFHELISGLLYRWICGAVAGNRRAATGHVSQDLVIRCQPLSADTLVQVDRTNSLISRQLLSLKRGETVIYPCPAEYRAASLLLNASRTSAFLNFTSPLGNASVDVRFRDQPTPWVAAVARIPETLGPEQEIVGGGDICMTVSDQPVPPENRNVFRSIDIVAGPAQGVAEVGELILVRRDWRTAEAAGEDAPAPNIEAAGWAVEFISELAVTGARTVAGIARSHAIIRRSTLLNLLNDAFAENDPATRDACKARFLVAAHEFAAARAAIADGLGKDPGHALLLEMQDSLAELGS